MRRAGVGAAIWALWKRATGALIGASASQVDQAMDRATRRRVPWRFRVWSAAWIVLVIAYLPLAGLFAFILSFSNPADSVLQDVLLYGPTVFFGVLGIGCIAAGAFGPTVPPSAPKPEDPAKVKRRDFWWRALTTGLLLIFVGGKVLEKILG